VKRTSLVMLLERLVIFQYWLFRREFPWQIAR